MKRRQACIGALSLSLGRGLALAQQPAKRVFRVGWLSQANVEQNEFFFMALQDALRERGWQPGVDVVFERRYAEGDRSRLDALAAELVRANSDVIVAIFDSTGQAVRRATATIPIVVVDMNDPVGYGLIASLARPGGNVTGVTWSVERSLLYTKPLQYLRELRPGLSRAAALHLASPAWKTIGDEARETARSIGVALECIELPNSGELDASFAAMKKSGAEVLLFWPVSIANAWHSKVAKRALDERLPSASQDIRYPREGGLLAYGPPPGESFRRAAVHVDKILRGANPGELPVDQAARFDLVVNRRTATALGIELPRSLLLRAERVIE